MKSGDANTRGGFTLLEIIVVIAVTMLLSTTILVYSSASRQQVVLYTETAKLSQVIARAKSLTLSSYATGVSECGFGVHMDYASRRVDLVSYQTPNCASIVSLPAFTVKESFTLNSDLTMPSGPDRVDDILFVAPDPKTVLNFGGTLLTDRTGNVYLRTKDGSLTRRVSVSPGGQINF